MSTFDTIKNQISIIDSKLVNFDELKTKGAIVSLSHDMRQLKSSIDDASELTSVQKKILTNRFNNAIAKFSDNVNAMNDQKNKDKIKTKYQIKEFITIKNPTLNNQEVEQIMMSIENKQYSSTSMNSIYVANNVALEKYIALVSLEQDLEELHELFVDMANLVYLQGTHVNTITKNITTADINVAKGTEELYKAREHQKKARKLMCCSIM